MTPSWERESNGTLSILWTSIMYLNLRQSVLTGMPMLLQSRDYTCAPPPNINGCSNQALALSNPEGMETFNVFFERAVPLASELMDLSHDPTRAETYELLCTTQRRPDTYCSMHQKHYECPTRRPARAGSHHARHSIPPAPPVRSPSLCTR
jgi:hypothetical protein